MLSGQHENMLPCPPQPGKINTSGQIENGIQLSEIEFNSSPENCYKFSSRIRRRRHRGPIGNFRFEHIYKVLLSLHNLWDLQALCNPFRINCASFEFFSSSREIKSGSPRCAWDLLQYIQMLEISSCKRLFNLANLKYHVNLEPFYLTNLEKYSFHFFIAITGNLCEFYGWHIKDGGQGRIGVDGRKFNRNCLFAFLPLSKIPFD